MEEEEEGGVLEEENIKAAAQSAIQSWENGKGLFAKTTKKRSCCGRLVCRIYFLHV